MRRLAFLTLPLLLSAAAFAFEGDVTFEIKADGGKPVPMTYQMKGDRLRLNTESREGKAAMIFLPKEKSMILMMPDRKLAMKREIPETAAKPGATSSIEFKRTPRKELIAGHECTVYTYEGEESEGEVCTAEGMGSFYFSGGGRTEPPAWARAARDQGLFPLRTLNRDAKTGRTMTMVATKIDSRALPDSVFQVPSDFQLTEMPSTSGGVGADRGGVNPTEMAQRLQNATPEERQKILEEMRKAYGDPSR